MAFSAVEMRANDKHGGINVKLFRGSGAHAVIFAILKALLLAHIGVKAGR